MSWRINRARFFIRLGNFIQSLPVVMMKPDELIEFSRQTYARSGNVQAWREKTLVDSGLNQGELALINSVPDKDGNLLLLGVGGGREAVAFAKMGFSVTGVDFIEEMANGAKVEGAKRGVTINALVQEISHLLVTDNFYNVVWISNGMYSSLPTRKRRVEMVRRILKALKPDGYFLCQFHKDPRVIPPRNGIILRRFIAALTLGNTQYEPGDILWQNIEFLHSFRSEHDVKSELEEGGFSVVKYVVDERYNRPGFICRKIAED